MALGVETVERMKDGQLVQHFLMASFAYYHRNESPMTDHAFDMLCQRLLDRYDHVVHPHKYLIDKDMLRAGSGYNLRWEDYPTIVKVAVTNGYAHNCESGQLQIEIEPHLLPKQDSAPMRVRRTRPAAVPATPPPAPARRVIRSRPQGKP